MNTLLLNYKKGNSDGSLLNELKEATNSQIGWSHALRITWVHDNKFTVSSGFDYDLIRLKFSAEKESPTTVTEENYLVRFGINPQTGDTINQEYIVKELNALLKRKVVHIITQPCLFLLNLVFKIKKVN